MHLPILNTWPDYFENHHEGLGTTYERFVLHSYFKQLLQTDTIESVLEAPSFGMTGISGINSLWWAAQGIAVTVADDQAVRLVQIEKIWHSIPLTAQFVCVQSWSDLRFADHMYDLSWNFAALWLIPPRDQLLAELARVTRKVILICVPNQAGLGYRCRATLNSAANDSTFPDHNNHQAITTTLSRLGWRLRQSGCFDVPPWPDVAMKKEDLFKKIKINGLIRLLDGKKSAPPRELCILNHFNGQHPLLEQEILKYDWFESAPNWFKKRWAHHRYLIFERGSR